ncbi:MAG: FecR domain-containing protein [Pseudomonadota bacterium]
MSRSDKERLLREATRIYLRLNANPDDPGLIQERDSFLARGSEARKAYETIERTWAVTGKKPKSRVAVIAAFGLLLGGLLYGAQDSLRVAFLADQRTTYSSAELALMSGDTVTLDAGSALSDRSDGTMRRVDLIQGAAFFEVTHNDTPFIVDLGAVEVEVLGTQFETAHLDNGVMVAVSEGRVAVRDRGRAWTLDAGEMLVWSGGTDVEQSTLPADQVAPWRQDALIADGLSFAHVVDIIDRRLPGPVFVANRALADVTVSGGLDLSDPTTALRALAATEGARVLTIPGVGTIVLR